MSSLMDLILSCDSLVTHVTLPPNSMRVSLVTWFGTFQ